MNALEEQHRTKRRGRHSRRPQAEPEKTGKIATVVEHVTEKTGSMAKSLSGLKVSTLFGEKPFTKMSIWFGTEHC